MNIHSSNVRDVAEMARALKLAGAFLETLLSGAASSPGLPLGNSNEKHLHTTVSKLPPRWSNIKTDWPQIGGRRFKPIPPEIFVSSAYLATYRPGLTRAGYVAICDGTETLSKQFKMPIAKTSSCDGDRLPDRLRDITTEEYGSVYLNGDRQVRQQGFKGWRTQPVPDGLILSPNSPVILTEHALLARMPQSMTRGDFDSRYDELVRLGSVGSWVETDAGILHCQRVGVSPELGQRFTVRKRGKKIDREQSLEIVAFRPKMDYQRLVAIIERVILEHLGLFAA